MHQSRTYGMLRHWPLHQAPPGQPDVPPGAPSAPPWRRASALPHPPAKHVHAAYEPRKSEACRSKPAIYQLCRQFRLRSSPLHIASYQATGEHKLRLPGQMHRNGGWGMPGQPQHPACWQSQHTARPRQGPAGHPPRMRPAEESVVREPQSCASCMCVGASMQEGGRRWQSTQSGGMRERFAAEAPLGAASAGGSSPSLSTAKKIE